MTSFPLIGFVVTLVLAGLVLAKNARKNTNRIFVSFIISIGVWILFDYLTDKTSDIGTALVYSKMSFIGPILIPLFFLIFSQFFPIKKYKTSRNKNIALSIPAIISLLLLFGSSIVSNVSFDKQISAFGARVSFEPGWGYYFFVAYFIIYMFIAGLTLIRTYRSGISSVKQQIKYLLTGITLSLVFSLVANIFLPLMHNNTLVKLGPSSAIITLGFITYAILRHRLLDIKIIITRSLVYGVILILVTLSFVFITFISGRFFDNVNTGQTVVAFFVSILIVFGLDPLKRLLSRLTDKIFFQAKIDYTKLLQNLSSIISLELDLQKLIDDLEKGLIQGLKVRSSLILLRDRDNGKTKMFRATTETGPRKKDVIIENTSQLIQFVREHQHLSLLEALERKIEDTPEGPARDKEESSRAEFERLGVALVAPIFSENHLVAVLTLGPKMSGDSFSNDDTQLIEVLAPQIGSAIQKANLYEEVRQFSAGLKVKVEEATKELSDRNVSLQTLQTITKDITRTLDFGKVVQNIANAVATDLGFLGAILVFLDDDGKTLRARAVTETPLTSRAIKLLPKRFTDYTTDLTNPKTFNLGTQVISSGEIRFSNSMAEVLSPPIPKLIVQAIQKVMGIKTMILVPIVSEEKVIGVIEVGAKRQRDQISQREIETLQSMADELGVVARNITLFDRARKTNDQLEVANKHLQELDRAKSEFVSIASHQLRTPMTGIMGYLSMMTQGDFGKIQPEHQKILVDLLSESQRMIRLINQFLNVSKIEAGKFTYTWKPTVLEDLVEHVVKEIDKPAKEKGLKLTIKMPKQKLPVIQSDADKIEDVILNLLDNAIKYTAKGTVTATLSQDGNMIRFAVKDSGIGIKPEDASELFNKFVRGSGIAQIHPDGSGLGLFIAKSIIDAHGGRIWAESDGEGKGSTFQFTLPLKPPTDLPPVPLSAAAHIVKPKDEIKTLKNE